MSFQTIPDLNASVDFSRKDSNNLLLASIAFEEFGLARLIDAEAEKLQYVLGSLPNHPPLFPPATLKQILTVNRSVDQTLRDIIKKEILLQLKLESILAAQDEYPTPRPPYCDKCPVPCCDRCPVPGCDRCPVPGCDC